MKRLGTKLMTELNSCFTRNQFRRSTAARLFTIRTACNFSRRILSGFHLLLIHMHYFSFKFISQSTRQQHGTGSELPTEKCTSERNRQCWNKMRVLIRGNNVQISFEMPVYYFAVNSNTNSALRRPHVNLQFYMFRPGQAVLKKVQV